MLTESVTPPMAVELGQRVPRALCGARKHNGTRCRALPCPGKARCRRHGGMSTGPRTAAGKFRTAQNINKAARAALGKLDASASLKRSVSREIVAAVVARATAVASEPALEVRASGLGDRLTELTGKSLDHIDGVFSREVPRGKKAALSPADKFLTRERSDLAKAVLRAQVMSDQTAFMARRSAVLGEVVAALLGAEQSTEEKPLSIASSDAETG